MGLLTLMLALTSPLIVLHLLPHSHTIQFTTAQSSGNGQVSNQTSAMVVGDLINQIKANGGNLGELAKVIVCDGLQGRAQECSNVSPLKVFSSSRGVGRSKRHIYYPYYRPRYPPRIYNPLPIVRPPNIPGVVATCPTEIDQSNIYQLSGSTINYPAVGIANELFLDPVLLSCLSKEVVIPTDPPPIIVDAFRTTATATCPFTEQSLFSYNSVFFGGLCFVLQNFQEKILFVDCSTTFCNCNEGNVVRTSPNTLARNLCYTDYRTVSLWAYCPSQPVGRQIVRDRIVVPSACRCQSVQCTIR